MNVFYVFVLFFKHVTDRVEEERRPESLVSAEVSDSPESSSS